MRQHCREIKRQRETNKTCYENKVADSRDTRRRIKRRSYEEKNRKSKKNLRRREGKGRGEEKEKEKRRKRRKKRRKKKRIPGKPSVKPVSH